MSSSMPWFRFYSDTLTDRKIKYVCKKTGQSKALILGIWITLLSLANDSPERGKLILTGTTPYTIEDIEEETELPQEVILPILDEFKNLGMVEGNTILLISNWEKRQFRSDNSTERVREFRAQRSSETLPKRSSNALDTEEESESEKEQKQIKAPTPISPAPFISQFQDHTPQEMERFYCKITNQIFIPPDQKDSAIETLFSISNSYADQQKAIEDGKKVFSRWCATKSMKTGKSYSRTNTAWLNKWLEELAPSPADKKFEDCTTVEEMIEWRKMHQQQE